MPIKPLFASCPNYYERIFSLPVGKISFPTVLSSFVSSFFSPFNPYANEPSTSSIFLDPENIGIIHQTSNFRNNLEHYHPGKTRTLLNKVATK